MELTAASCGADRLGLKQFWQRAETVLAETPLRIPDRRRDAVALLDVFEARQWQLRVVFVCGLAERLFPHYHREDPVLGDRARSRLGLSIAKDRQIEERFLFNLATSRATEETVLSYARYNEKGDEQLASFFLEQAPPALPGARMRPAPSREVYTGPPAPIQEPEQLARLADRHKTISPTSIEDFLQCPFLFFGRKTLRLKERPPQPRDRLDNLAQGSILHHALALWGQAPIFGASLLDQAFDEEIAKRRIPMGYRTEAVRLELMRHFEAFLKDDQVPAPRDVRVEQKVSFPLNPTISITGRIDRVDVGPGKQALVIDYKYSAAERIKKNVAQSEDGDRVQAGLYLLAAQKALGLDPLGMLYCGLRKTVSWSGWHFNRADLRTVGEARTKEALQELIDGARQATLETHEAILTGRIVPRPKDRDICKRCDFRDICRVGTLGEAMEAGAE
jgi:ATP-dependent helicase/DNAse subunit B